MAPEVKKTPKKGARKTARSRFYSDKEVRVLLEDIRAQNRVAGEKVDALAESMTRQNRETEARLAGDINALAGLVRMNGKSILEQGRKLDEHGLKLDEHGRTLAEHGRKLDEHTRRLEAIERKVDEIDSKLNPKDGVALETRVAALERAAHP